MNIKVSDYIADFLADKNITQVFTVVGGGAMHLNDSIGHHPKLNCIYNHHEQACAIAAEGYARIHNEPAAVCVTSGPGAVNALNGVVGAYQDSIPMIVLSGQTKSSLTVQASGLNLRTLGNQEFPIVSALEKMTKYAEMIMDPKRIRYCLEKAYDMAVNGRPGPCWLDIPLDIQGAFVDADTLQGYEPENEGSEVFTKKELSETCIDILNRLKNSERPVIYAGNGVRLSGGVDLLYRLASVVQIPIVTCWDSIDLVPTDDDIYCGRGGIMGDRAGNFAVQNSDLLICIGTRLNIYQVGYNVKTWAREAYVCVVDIDSEELKKPIMRADLPICADAADFMQILLDACIKDSEALSRKNRGWLEQCKNWKTKYPVVQKKHYQETDSDKVNVYAFIDCLSRELSKNSITVVANGSASVVGSQSYYIKKNDRFVMNCGFSSMGYGLPAAIGACMANNRQSVVCIEGDGSIMMNLQELQTVVTNNLPIKIFIINNEGYHQIRQTQTNLFGGRKLVGVGNESGDLGFPEFSKIAYAFGIEYFEIQSGTEMKKTIQSVLEKCGAVICEVFVSKTQKFEPKSATKRLADGTLVSPPLEDLAPFLSREDLEENMYISLVEEKS